jgi:hypothetical protein
VVIVPVTAKARLEAGRSVTKAQLEAWLVGPRVEALTESARSRRFVLAVLRDFFPNDFDVQLWLTTPRAELRGATARELLTSHRIGEVEALVVRLWNQVE